MISLNSICGFDINFQAHYNTYDTKIKKLPMDKFIGFCYTEEAERLGTGLSSILGRM